ncbi:MAG: VanW family protein [Clostridia bacterium]|nr:VanW family protein [Clostridia bacterium]
MKDMKLRTKIIIASVAVLLVAVITFLAIITLDNNIYKGVSVAGIDLSGMSIDAAEAKLSSEIKADKLPAFVCNGREFEISPSDISLRCDGALSAQSAYNYGRSANYFTRMGNIFYTMSHPVNLPLIVAYDEAALNSEFDKYISDLRVPSVEPTFRLEGDKLYIKNGALGVDVNREKLNNDLANVVMGSTDKIQLVIDEVAPTPISAQSIHDAYARPAVNAEYTISNQHITYTESQTGIDFDMAEAEQIIADNINNTEEYFIPLTVVEPEITTEQLDASMFGDLLGTYTTTYNPSEIGRTKNVTLASNSIHNVVLAPGEEFSYNNIVGERTVERGFAGAKVYSMGEVVSGLGGGICQVSSTLYNTVLYAGLEIVSRTEHSLPVTYVPLGRDATVAYGAIDFVFKNPYPDAVKITSVIGGGKLTISVYGKKTSDKKIEIITERVSTSYFSVVEKGDESVAVGSSRVQQSGSNGAVVNTYLKITENGNTTTKFLHTSYYSPINKVVLVNPSTLAPAETAPEGESPAEENTSGGSTPDAATPEQPTAGEMPESSEVTEVTAPTAEESNTEIQ